MNSQQHARQFTADTHACAMQMLENAAYIQKELPALDMPESLRTQIVELCAGLIATKHDLIHELGELDGFLESAPYQIEPWMERLHRWIRESVVSIDRCVQAVDEAVTNGTASDLVLMLVMESATNIMDAIPSLPESDGNNEADSAPADFTEDAEEKCDHDSDDGCYGFYSEDSYPVGQLVDVIRDIMERPELSTEAVAQLRVFLFAMERLPLVTPGVRMSLGLRLDQGGESDWIEIRIEDDIFTLGRGSWIDGDADTETVFEAGPDYRDGDAFQASNFAQSFLSCAEDVCREVVIADSSDEPFNGWDLEKDTSRWGKLPCSYL